MYAFLDLLRKFEKKNQQGGGKNFEFKKAKDV
jgi:hypothetical protein